MAALSRATVPGRLDRTIGNETRAPAFRRSALITSLTPFRMSARVELPSRAARDFSWRYSPSGISTVVRMRPLCHIYGAGRIEEHVEFMIEPDQGFRQGRSDLLVTYRDAAAPPRRFGSHFRSRRTALGLRP